MIKKHEVIYLFFKIENLKLDNLFSISTAKY